MIRLILLLAAALLGIWAWRSARGDAPAPRAKGPPPAPPVQDMARCAHCGVHFPRTEGVPGRQGLYCGPEHLRLAEKG
jgi:uncharacterized protein